MNHSIVLDPTAERAPAQRARLARPASLEGKVVGLLDISKPRGNVPRPYRGAAGSHGYCGEAL